VLVFGRSFFDSVDNEYRLGMEMHMSTTSKNAHLAYLLGAQVFKGVPRLGMLKMVQSLSSGLIKLW
jgi:hypothetical protein